MKFSSEKQLLDTALTCRGFTEFVSKATRTYLIEPKGLFGIPDLVVVELNKNNSLQTVSRAYAFEMKLSNWRRALIQAYRYRSFAEMSFVVLDYANVRPALANLDLFRRANLGLLSIDAQGCLSRHFVPRPRIPYCENVRANLCQLVTSTTEARKLRHEPNATVYEGPLSLQRTEINQECLKHSKLGEKVF